MKNLAKKSFLTVIILSFFITSCGRKGPLFLPEGQNKSENASETKSENKSQAKPEISNVLDGNIANTKNPIMNQPLKNN